MYVTARAVSRPNLGPRVPFKSPTQVTDTQYLEPSCAASWDLDQKLRTRNSSQGTFNKKCRNPKHQLNSCVKHPPPLTHLLKLLFRFPLNLVVERNLPSNLLSRLHVAMTLKLQTTLSVKANIQLRFTHTKRNLG